MGELAAALVRYLRGQPALSLAPVLTHGTLSMWSRRSPRCHGRIDRPTRGAGRSCPRRRSIPPDAPPELVGNGDPREPVTWSRLRLILGHGIVRPAPPASRRPSRASARVRGCPGEPGGSGGAQSEDAELKSHGGRGRRSSSCLRSRRTRRRVGSRDYESLHNQLIRACRSRVEASDEAKRPLYECLETLAQPWLTLGSLVQLDREIPLRPADSLPAGRAEAPRPAAGRP